MCLKEMVSECSRLVLKLTVFFQQHVWEVYLGLQSLPI